MENLCSTCKPLPGTVLSNEFMFLSAVNRGHVDCVEILLKGADVNNIPHALLQAAGHGFTGCVKHLLKPESMRVKSVACSNALVVAARSGHVNVVEVLVEAGADVNQSDERGRIALIEASEWHNDHIVKYLIGAGADVNVPDRTGNTALNAASNTMAEHATVYTLSEHPTTTFGRCEETVIAELLVKAGADVNNAPSCLDSHLTVASLTKARYVKLILRSNIKINIAGSSVNTLTFYLTYSQKINRKIVMLLFAAGEKIMPSVGCTNTTIPEYLQHEQLSLKEKCRETIRKHLLDIDPHGNLFHRIPKIGLPSVLDRYVLFGMSIDGDDDDDDNDDDDNDDDDDDDDDDYSDFDDDNNDNINSEENGEDDDNQKEHNHNNNGEEYNYGDGGDH